MSRAAGAASRRVVSSSVVRSHLFAHRSRSAADAAAVLLSTTTETADASANVCCCVDDVPFASMVHTELTLQRHRKTRVVQAAAAASTSYELSGKFGPRGLSLDCWCGVLGESSVATEQLFILKLAREHAENSSVSIINLVFVPINGTTHDTRGIDRYACGISGELIKAARTARIDPIHTLRS